MRANPGGQIPPSEVVGRDELIERLWQWIETQSLLLCAERRMGKTCIVKKMVAEAPKDRLCVLRFRFPLIQRWWRLSRGLN
jgi:hypothetical protein